MTYPSEWNGDLASKSGVAHFKVEGIEYAFRLEDFASYHTLCEMLDAAFDQGRSFAASVMEGHVMRAIEQAKVDRNR